MKTKLYIITQRKLQNVSREDSQVSICNLINHETEVPLYAMKIGHVLIFWIYIDYCLSPTVCHNDIQSKFLNVCLLCDSHNKWTMTAMWLQNCEMEICTFLI